MSSKDKIQIVVMDKCFRPYVIAFLTSNTLFRIWSSTIISCYGWIVLAQPDGEWVLWCMIAVFITEKTIHHDRLRYPDGRLPRQTRTLWWPEVCLPGCLPLLLNYIQDILAFTRSSAHFHMGLSPRAGMAITQAARSWSYISGRDYVLPEDVQKIMPWVVGHRLRSKEDLEEIPRQRLVTMLSEVPIP